MTPERWWELWSRLCKRFRREIDAEEAALYLDYIGLRLSGRQIEEAAQALWATREFFPRPVDFVLAAHVDVLRQVREAGQAFRENRNVSLNNQNGRNWVQIAGGHDSMALAIIRQLGGIMEVEGLLGRGPAAVRREVEATLAAIVLDEAKALPESDYDLLGAAV